MSWKKFNKEILMSRTYQLSVAPLRRMPPGIPTISLLAHQSPAAGSRKWTSCCRHRASSISLIGGPSSPLTDKMTRRAVRHREPSPPGRLQLTFDLPPATLRLKALHHNVPQQRLFEQQRRARQVPCRLPTGSRRSAAKAGEEGVRAAYPRAVARRDRRLGGISEAAAQVARRHRRKKTPALRRVRRAPRRKVLPIRRCGHSSGPRSVRTVPLHRPARGEKTLWRDHIVKDEPARGPDNPGAGFGVAVEHAERHWLRRWGQAAA